MIFLFRFYRVSSRNDEVIKSSNPINKIRLKIHLNVPSFGYHSMYAKINLFKIEPFVKHLKTKTNICFGL